MFKAFPKVIKFLKIILILLFSSRLNSSISFFDKFQNYESYFELPNASIFLFSCYSTNVCRDLRDCPVGRESRSVPTIFVSRETRTGAEVFGTSGTGTNFRETETKNRETVPSRPLPIPVPECSTMAATTALHPLLSTQSLLI